MADDETDKGPLRLTQYSWMTFSMPEPVGKGFGGGGKSGYLWTPLPQAEVLEFFSKRYETQPTITSHGTALWKRETLDRPLLRFTETEVMPAFYEGQYAAPPEAATIVKFTEGATMAPPPQSPPPPSPEPVAATGWVDR